MSAIEASSVGVKTMADGTLRITVDIEPTSAQAAFALFGAPGTPMALAALKVGHAAKSDSVDTSEERVQKSDESEHVADQPKGGTLAQSAAIICNESAFREFAEQRGYMRTENGASAMVCDYCGITSRRFLDHDKRAAAQLAILMGQYREWQKATA